MARVIVGALVGAIIGGLIARNIHYNDVIVHVAFPQAQGVGSFDRPINFVRLVQAIGLIAGVATGALVGAIAGATSALPNVKPLGAGFWITLAVLLVLFLLALAAYWLMPSGVMMENPDRPAPQPPPNPQALTRIELHEYASRFIPPQFTDSVIT